MYLKNKSLIRIFHDITPPQQKKRKSTLKSKLFGMVICTFFNFIHISKSKGQALIWKIILFIAGLWEKSKENWKKKTETIYPKS